MITITSGEQWYVVRILSSYDGKSIGGLEVRRIIRAARMILAVLDGGWSTSMVTFDADCDGDSGARAESWTYDQLAFARNAFSSPMNECGAK